MPDDTNESPDKKPVPAVSPPAPEPAPEPEASAATPGATESRDKPDDDADDSPDAGDSEESADEARAADPAETPAAREERRGRERGRKRGRKSRGDKNASGDKKVEPREELAGVAASAIVPDSTASAAGDVASADDSDAPLPPAPRFKPAKPRLRDWLLTFLPIGVLAWVMLHRGDVQNPRGDDPAHRLSHYASLWHSGHVPGGMLIGIVCVFLAAIGILGLLGDSPMDLRGDEVTGRPADVAAKPWYKHEGTWLVGFCVLLYVPLAGAYGLWDPWETHYSEVAREVLARDDWITLWWGQEGWFMSKPILIFWMSAIGMGIGSAFGLPFWRDMGPGLHEWFIRLPIIFLAIGAVYAIYRAVRTAWGPRAGLLSGLVLATMPHWFFLSHQAMTDMPFVAPLVIGMSFLMLAIVTDPEKLATPKKITIFGRTFRVSLWHLGVGAIVMVALPQVIYLLTRPVWFICPEGSNPSCQSVLVASRVGPIQLPIERYWSGSASNSVLNDRLATVPGSPAWEDRWNQIPGFPSVVQGLIWMVIATVLLMSFRKERRAQPVFFWVMYLFSAISFMGKGPAGLGVPEIVLLGFMITTNRWRLLTQFRFFQGIGIFFLCGMPWYIGIYCRLGNEFFDRFVVHDLLNRAFAGVHGDTGTFRYFIWQLGYGMFPWIGFAPAALVGWKLYVPPHATRQQKDIVRVAILWVAVTFTLFSLMVTKFHHYIFPMVPGTALLIGLLMHRLLGDRRLAATSETVVATATLVAGTGTLILGVTNFFGAWHGQVARVAPFRLPPGSTPLGVALCIVGVALIGYAWSVANKAERRVSDALVEPRRSSSIARTGAIALGAVGLCAAVLVGLVGRDIGVVGTSRPAGFERFMHLFTYNYDRPFPTRSYDYHAILTGFGVVAVLAAAMVALERMRRHGVRMMFAVAACFGFWALDKYMIDLSNHWSQRNLFVRYYQMRGTREAIGFGEDARYWADPIAAYQMNWKGENFYTGNHAAMLECGLPLCQERTPDWMRRHQGQRIFIVTEHSRSSSIIGQVRQAGGNAHNVSDEYDNNKFVLIAGQL